MACTGRLATFGAGAKGGAGTAGLRAHPAVLVCSGHVKDLYASLGVPRGATAGDIKKAYRDLTRKHHPDRNPGDNSAEERFKEVSAAYQVLGDADKRKLYDEFGEMSLTQGFDPDRARAYQRAQRSSPFGGRASSGMGGMGDVGGPGGADFGDVFTSYDQAQHTAFDDLLSRLFGGGQVRGDFRRSTRRGVDIRGEISVSLLDALAGVTVPLRIESQDGTSRTLDVKVPAGVADGGTLRLRGQGGPGQPDGDILLTVRVKAHPRLSREGDDLRLRVPVTAYEAYRGGPIDVPTPWGTVSLKLPPGSQNGQVLRLRGRGVRKTKGDAGDLLVVLDVRMPAAGDEALLEALRQAQGEENVRAGLAL
jgi:DnaJ-class molecular chaperone